MIVKALSGLGKWVTGRSKRHFLHTFKNKKIMQLTATYKKLLADYGKWLGLIGYADSTVYKLSHHLKEFLLWQQAQQKLNIHELQAADIYAFMEVFKVRPNKRRGGGLSVAHINQQIESFKKLVDYLRHFKQLYLNVYLQALPNEKLNPTVFLTTEEITALYAVCEPTILGMRDRAMLGIYYGCGLRRSEGAGLNIEDINIEQQRLKVTKSKTGRQRFVPIAAGVAKDLATYLYEARPFLTIHKKQTAFFVSIKGKRILSYTLYLRLKTLAKKAHLQHSIGIHTLRHSIASHLLHQGMDLESIGRFLGHRCMDSTQIYTHLIHENVPQSSTNQATKNGL